MKTIDAQNLSVAFGPNIVLGDVSIALRTGELTALIGPNGAGKSTLVKALLGLIPHGGDVRFDGKIRQNKSRVERARFAAYLPQGQSHAWPLPVRDVVALGRYPHGERSIDAPALDKLLAKLDLKELANRPVLDLSGGEQMRVSLARAFAVEAHYLFADEPLTSLDPRFQFEIMHALREEADDGAGVVAVLHDLAMSARYADRVVLIGDGTILADGAPEEVLTPAVVGAAFRVRTSVRDIETKRGIRSVALPDAPDH